MKRPYGPIAAAAAAIAIGSLLLLAMYRPVLRSGPEISASPWVGSDELEGARLHVFNTGYNKMSWLLVGRERPWRPVPAFVIEYPEEGLLVFDTGLSDAVAELGEAGLHIPERWVIESRSRKPLMLPAQMRKAGLDADAVHHVAISHLHGDHVGQLEAFPHSKFIAGPGSATWGQDHGFGERWQELTWDSATPYGPFDGAVQMPGDRGVVFVRGGGHAHEGLMLLLALDHGPVLLAGDAVVHSDWLRSNDVQRIPVDPDRAAVVRNQVRSFASEVPGSVVVYGHDLRELDCTRPDIVCHGAARFHPEGEDSPLP